LSLYYCIPNGIPVYAQGKHIYFTPRIRRAEAVDPVNSPELLPTEKSDCMSARSSIVTADDNNEDTNNCDCACFLALPVDMTVYPKSVSFVAPFPAAPVTPEAFRTSNVIEIREKYGVGVAAGTLDATGSTTFGTLEDPRYMIKITILATIRAIAVPIPSVKRNTFVFLCDSSTGSRSIISSIPVSDVAASGGGGGTATGDCSWDGAGFSTGGISNGFFATGALTFFDLGLAGIYEATQATLVK